MVSVVMPCLNESETIGTCIDQAKETLQKYNIDGEIVVADNGSTDDSVKIAESKGARVVYESARGYGNAYRTGIAAARGQYVIIGDSDESYDFREINRFLEKLKEGYDVVMGTRMKGKIEKNAMPWLHRYIGNPLLTGILNLFFNSGISDAHCGLRAFTKDAFHKMELKTSGMEFASEIVIKSALTNLKMTEIPITLHKDGRSRAPHLRSFRDGWRHLRFMLMHSPTHLYLWPGFALFFFGMLALVLLLPGPLYIAGRMIDIHIMVLGDLCAILGLQIISIGVFARVYALVHGFIPHDKPLQKAFKYFNLERGILAGAVIFLTGFVIDLYILIKWILNNFGALDQVRLALFASTLIILGVQIIFSSFFLSMIGLSAEDQAGRPY